MSKEDELVIFCKQFVLGDGNESKIVVGNKYEGEVFGSLCMLRNFLLERWLYEVLNKLKIYMRY